MFTPLIRPLQENDYEAWLPLWAANNDGHADDVLTATTWRRLIDPEFPMKGMGAWVEGGMRGLVHYVVHPVTGHLEPACYMQDLFVDPGYRRRGIGRALVTALGLQARSRSYARLYWLTEVTNQAAQALYASIGIQLAFSLFVLPL